jgi:ADP-ribose 1''-phosphate phosphatase
MNYVIAEKNIFSAPSGSILVHAVNSCGIMGAGLALQMKKLLPANYIQYKDFCKSENTDKSGKCFIGVTSHFLVGNLVTSKGFGQNIDNEDKILENTYSSLKDMFEQLNEMPLERKLIVSSKFNSGLFNVPWHKTESIIHHFLAQKSNEDFKWIVCDIDSKQKENK